MYSESQHILKRSAFFLDCNAGFKPISDAMVPVFGNKISKNHKQCGLDALRDVSRGRWGLKSVKINPKIEQHYELRWKPMCKEMIELIEEHPNSRLVRLPTDDFEDAPFYNDTLMYFDSGHLNVFGSEKYALSTEEEMMDAIEWGIGETSEQRLAKHEE